jgi:tRNA dimethylallyltransferase
LNMWKMALNGKLLVILGPTASGKTGLGIELANALNGEVIGADSRQIYRYMDIGTAKPTLEQRQQAAHHLLDIVNPDENLSLAQYQHMAYSIIDEILQRGKLPILVGGTGQYITAVIEGWLIPEVPPNPALRAELEAFAAENGSEALHTRLRQLDPGAAASIHHRNVRRVVRALEVCLETGQPMSQLQQKRPPQYDILQYGLQMERDKLYERADQRLSMMMQQGFLEEVHRLLDMGYNRQLPSMSGLGYRELASHILDRVPLAEAVAATSSATRDFIRRQFTWFRGHDNGIIWLDVEPLKTAAIRESSLRWLEA